MALYRNIDIVQEVYKRIFLIRVAVDEAQNYFDLINEYAETYKNTLSKRGISSLDSSDLDVEFLLLRKHNSVAFDWTEITEEATDDLTGSATSISLVDSELRNYTNDLYNSERRGYDAILNSRRDSLTATQDAFLKLNTIIAKYNTDIIVNKGVAAEVIDIETIITNAIGSGELNKEQNEKLAEYTNELYELMNKLGLNVHCEFDTQGYLEKVVGNIVDTFDNTDKVRKAISEDKLEKFRTLLLSLKQNHSSLPLSIQEYEHLYLDDTVVNEELEYILADESEDMYELINELENVQTTLPTEVQDTYVEVTPDMKETINVFAGNEPESLPEIIEVLKAIVEYEDELPADLRNELADVNLNELKYALESEDYDRIAEFGPEIAPFVEAVQEKLKTESDIQEIHSSTLEQLAIINEQSKSSSDFIDEDLAWAIGDLAYYQDMSSVKNVLEELFDIELSGMSFDSEISRILGSLPSNIMDLNLDNILDLLQVNNPLSDLFGRLDIMSQFTSLSNLIPDSISSLLGNISPGISHMLSGISQLTGITGLVSNLVDLSGLGQLSSTVQGMLSSVMGGMNLGSVLGILQGGNLGSIASIAGNLGNMLSNFGSMIQDIPAKIIDTIGNLGNMISEGIDKIANFFSEGISGLLDNLSGLLSNFDISSLLSGLMDNLGSLVMALIPSQAMQLINYSKQILSFLNSKYQDPPIPGGAGGGGTPGGAPGGEPPDFHGQVPPPKY